MSPKPEILPPEFTKHLIEPEEYPGAYIKHIRNDRLVLVTGPMSVYKKGDVIIGRDIDEQFLPIYNSEGKVTTRNTKSKTTELLTVERVEELGLLSYIIPRVQYHIDN